MPSSTGLHGRTLQLFFLLLLPLMAILMAVAFGSSGLHEHAMRNLVGERDARAARATAAALAEQLDHRASAVRQLALLAVTASPEQALADSAFLQADFEGGLSLWTADGRLLASDIPADNWVERPVASLLSQINPAEPAFSPTFTDPANNQPAVLVAAIQADVAAVGLFYPADLAAQALADTFPAGNATTIFLISETEQLLYQAGNEPEGEAAGHPGVAEALAGHSGTTHIMDGEEEHIVAYSQVRPAGWALVIEEPWQTVVDPTLQATLVAPLALAPALLLALAALWFAGRQIVRPLQQLAGLASELGWGRFEAIQTLVGGISEIRHLQAELIHMANKVQAAQKSLHSYVGAVTAGQEEERRRLARELHDDTIQSLIALNQRLQLAQMSGGHQLSPGQAASTLAEMQQMVSQMIEEVRRFVRDLRPIYLEDLGLAAALHVLTDDSSQTMAIPVYFNKNGRERRLPPEVELAFYRMAQEALSNVARHAQASQAWLKLAFTAEAVTLTIEDDGRGFTLPATPALLATAGHFGLLGLSERATLIGAHLDIQAAPGEGSRITITYGGHTASQ
jgi:signal transduction histidine kinase